MYLEKRSIGLCIVLTLVTCGIYGLYWMVKITNELHAVSGKETTASGGMALLFTLVTCGIYGFYWVYKMGDTVINAKMQRGLNVDNSLSIVYIVLYFCGLAIVAEALMQDAINDIIEFDASNSSSLMTSEKF